LYANFVQADSATGCHTAHLCESVDFVQHLNAAVLM